MKISTEEIDAAYDAVEATDTLAPPSRAIIQKAIEAAYRVRKERKKQNREKAIDLGEMRRVHAEWDSAADMLRGPIPPKPLTFEPGKSYRTRDGRKVYLRVVDSYRLYGTFCDNALQSTWELDGRDDSNYPSDHDLVALWED